MVESSKKADIGIITIREDEFAAVLRQLDDEIEQISLRRVYNLRRVTTTAGDAYRVAVMRCIEQGNGEAQEAARDFLEDLDPQWVLVVGIAGGAPSSDFSLGDVVVATRVHDFSVEAVRRDHAREYALAGGPIEREIAKVVANLPAMARALGPWCSAAAVGMARPGVDLAAARRYGDEAWQRKVERSLGRHFAAGRPRDPLVTSGAIASSDRLIKDDELLATFLRFARQVVAIEMESAGIYRATQPKRVPFTAIRGISDVVGLERDDDWTEYACRTAASFARGFLQTRPVVPRVAPVVQVPVRAVVPAPAPAGAAADRLEAMLARGTIRCGCIKHPPLCDFGWQSGRSDASGLYVDMCRAVAARHGLEVSFVPVEWSELSRSFEDLDLDFVLSIFETRQRQRFADFTASFHTVGVGAVAVHEPVKVTTVEDLFREDVRIIVTKGEVGWEYVAHELQLPKRRLIIVENADLTEMVDYVLSGKADAAICDSVSCHKIVQTDPRLRHAFREQPLYLCKNSIMVPKAQPQLARWVLDEFREARAIAAIQETEQRVFADYHGMIRRFT